MDPLADYLPPLNPIMKMAISGRRRVICYHQTIYDDDCWERNEFFSLTLTVQDESAVTTVVDPQLSSAVVKIVDDDCELHPCTAACHTIFFYYIYESNHTAIYKYKKDIAYIFKVLLV